MKKFSQTETKERNRRWNLFNSEILPELGFFFDVSTPNPGAYVAHGTPRGNLTIYPKGDKIQLSNGKWIDGNIIDWIKNNILKNKN